MLYAVDWQRELVNAFRDNTTLSFQPTGIYVYIYR
jgi:hypothetical protein